MGLWSRSKKSIEDSDGVQVAILRFGLGRAFTSHACQGEIMQVQQISVITSSAKSRLDANIKMYSHFLPHFATVVVTSPCGRSCCHYGLDLLTCNFLLQSHFQWLIVIIFLITLQDNSKCLQPQMGMSCMRDPSISCPRPDRLRHSENGLHRRLHHHGAAIRTTHQYYGKHHPKHGGTLHGVRFLRFQNRSYLGLLVKGK